jgi:hypothetical protein
MMRLVQEEPFVACGGLVYKTNYDRLFLTAELENEYFQTPVHPSEMSTITYVNVQDDYLFGTLTEYIRKEFTGLVRRRCRQHQEDRARAFASLAAEQRATVDGESTALGGGLFATAAGEAWYRYRCRNVTVLAAELP